MALSVPPKTPHQALRIAVDLLGGDAGPDVVVKGALDAAAAWPDIELQLVGPRDEAATLLAAQLPAKGSQAEALAQRITVVGATQRISMDEDPVRAVRSRRDASVRVASRLVRDGAADATVTVGSSAAAMAAALFTLGRMPGVTRPPLAVVVPAPRGPVILLDAGAAGEAGPDLLMQFALAGAAYAQVRLGIAEPSVGLVSAQSEPGKGVAQLLAELFEPLPVRFAGAVDGGVVAMGGVVDVVVTDGFTGNVLLKGMEGAVAAMLDAAAGELDPLALESLGQIGRRFGPGGQGGAVLLGVNGVVVVGQGASSPAAVCACVGVAAEGVREGLLPRLTAAMGGLIERRRTGHGPQSWLRS